MLVFIRLIWVIIPIIFKLYEPGDEWYVRQIGTHLLYFYER